MNPGDRVMVYDSPGSPLDHYLYATVLQPFDAGAAVLIDHPGNVSHAQQKFVALNKIMRAGDARRLAEQAKAEMAAAPDADRRRKFFEQIKHHEFVATQLSE